MEQRKACQTPRLEGWLHKTLPGKRRQGAGTTYLDRIAMGLVGILGPALKVKAVLGSSMFRVLALSCGLIDKGPATMPRPVSTRACPREPALDPSRGISFLAWKFRGLLPRTTIGAVVDSVRTALDPLDSVPTTLRCSTKCCWSSFRRPLFAVALQPSFSTLAAAAVGGVTRAEKKDKNKLTS